MAIAHREFVGRDGIGAGEFGEAVDGVDLGGGGEVEDALCFAEEVLGGMTFGAEAEHAIPAQPPCGGHGSDVG